MDPSRVWVGAQAVVLVDHVPDETSVLLLNRGLFTVYVGGPYVDGPSTGVPLAPLGSLAVPADRQWFGVADPAANGDKQAVYRVPGGTSYSPAPSEIAAQIAASQLAAAIGQAVPVPPSALQIGAAVPSAAQIGTEVGNRVPVPPTALQIGAAVPSAAQVGTEVGNRVPVPPSAGQIGAAVPQPGALATAAFTQGSRAVDSSTISFNSFGIGGGAVFPIDTALSVEINWHFTAGVVGTARQWGMLKLEWQDAAGNDISVDAFELVFEPGGMGAVSHGGVIRAPALGTQVLVRFTSCPTSPALSAGSVAAVRFVQSSRPTDRVRYFPGALGTGFAGTLAVLPGTAVAAGGTLAVTMLEVLSAEIDVLLYASAASVIASIFRGSGMDAGGFGEAIPLTAGTASRQRLAGIRSHVGVSFRNAGAGATTVYLLAVAADN